MINDVKDPSVLTWYWIFSIIAVRGNLEQGANGEVYREVFSFFRLEFSFVRHDHFNCEYVSIARILVVGFKPVSYFPIFLSQVYACFTSFGKQVPEEMLLQPLNKYLSPMEEEIIDKVLKSRYCCGSKRSSIYGACNTVGFHHFVT